MSQILTDQDFANAKRDISDIDKAVNTESIVDPRWGGDFKSLPMVSKEWDAKTQDAQSTINSWQEAINTIVINDGVPALAVSTANGNNQQAVNDLGGVDYWAARSYQANNEVRLDDGTVVISTIDNNSNNPNSNMTGWKKKNSADQIFDESGKTQQEINTMLNGVGSTPRGLGQPDSTTYGVNNNVYIGGYGVYDTSAASKTRPAWDAIGGTAPGASVNTLKLTGHVIKEGLDSAIIEGGRAGYYNYVGEKGSLTLTYGGDNFNGHLAGIVTAFHCDLISDANGVGSHGIACGGSFAQIAGDYSGSFAGTRKKVFALSSVALGGSSVQIGAITDATLVRRGGTLGGLNLSMVAGYESVMLGGSSNTHTSGNRSAILGGESNEMAANWATILGGKAVKVTADYSVARGWGVVGDIPYASAYNNGYFSTVADNQTYQMMLRRVGTNTSADVFLSASGGSGVDVYTVKPNQLGLASFDVQGFNTDTKSVYAFNVKVVFSTLGGSLAIKSTKVDILHDDDKTTSGVEPNIITTNSFSVVGISVASGARLGLKITTNTAINSRWTANGFITVQNL